MEKVDGGMNRCVRKSNQTSSFPSHKKGPALPRNKGSYISSQDEGLGNNLVSSSSYSDTNYWYLNTNNGNCNYNNRNNSNNNSRVRAFLSLLCSRI